MTLTKQIPREKGLDHTLSVLKEGYLFIPNRLETFRSPIFETRLLGQRAIVISGKDAAELFYDEDKMKRSHVIPKRIQKSLFGVGGVQGLDDQAHRHRKQLFMSLLTRERVTELLELVENQLERAAVQWERMPAVPFFREMEKLLFHAVCQWAGVPLWAKELDQRAKDMGAMIDAFGAVGFRHIRGRKARKRSELWIESIIEQVRAGKLFPDQNSALFQISWHKELNGSLLDSKVATVELINILRPTVAIARFIAFGVVAWADYPDTRVKFMEGNEKDRLRFVQEVRRYYPFGPFLGAKTRFNFNWKGYPFKEGTLVILDIYGTNHSEEIWEEPNTFSPERFEGWKGSPFSFIPQGGGDDDVGHRCAGEGITVELMKTCLGFLTDQLSYSLPSQDLTYRFDRIPSIPESRVVLTNVKRE